LQIDRPDRFTEKVFFTLAARVRVHVRSSSLRRQLLGFQFYDSIPSNQIRVDGDLQAKRVLTFISSTTGRGDRKTHAKMQTGCFESAFQMGESKSQEQRAHDPLTIAGRCDACLFRNYRSGCHTIYHSKNRREKCAERSIVSQFPARRHLLSPLARELRQRHHSNRAQGTRLLATEQQRDYDKHKE